MGILSPKSMFSGIFTPVGDMSGIWGFFGDFWVFHENIWFFFVKCGTFMSSFRIPYLKFCLLENGENWGIYWKIPT